MVRKIISSGQSGADLAALDVAIKFNIPHGGWIPIGRKTKDVRLSDRYKLKEMSTSSYPARTEKNVLESDGSLIFSRGNLTGGPEYIRQMILMHKKNMFHIDLNIPTSYDAASFDERQL